jgi:hypothetical protein
MTLYLRFTAVVVVVVAAAAAAAAFCGSLFLSGVYYCLSVFWYAVVRILERTLNFLSKLAEWKQNQRDVSASLWG